MQQNSNEPKNPAPTFDDYCHKAYEAYKYYMLQKAGITLKDLANALEQITVSLLEQAAEAIDKGIPRSKYIKKSALDAYETEIKYLCPYEDYDGFMKHAINDPKVMSSVLSAGEYAEFAALYAEATGRKDHDAVLPKPEKTRMQKCRHCLPGLAKNNESACVQYRCLAGNHPKIVTDSVCENCDEFDSRYIEYPLTINGIDYDGMDRYMRNAGQLVRVRPCGKEYGGKTYLGIHLGDQPAWQTASFSNESKRLKIGTCSNPAIYVPELNEIIFGMESWWSAIDEDADTENLKPITDELISSQWYVQLAKLMSGQPDCEDKADAAKGGSANA